MTLGNVLTGLSYQPDGDREFRCEDCRARCTVGTYGETEYGHMTGCPHRPESWPRGGQHVDNADHLQSDDGRRVATDGGHETFECEQCGDRTPTDDRWRYMTPDQPDVGPVQYQMLCPQCSTTKASERLFRAADDQGGDA